MKFCYGVGARMEYINAKMQKIEVFLIDLDGVQGVIVSQFFWVYILTGYARWGALSRQRLYR